MAIQRQLPLFSEPSEDVSLPRPVNVASVPQRSPFRYPGGKTWFVPTFHGGILAEGSRFIRHGENGKGIGSRWYAKTLAQRLVDLNHVVSRIDFRCDDGLKVMVEFASREDAIYFVDPPYTAGGKKAGKRLYKHHQIDHEHLFTICESLVGDFLMTYDEAEEVKEMARRHGFQMRLIPMKNTHHTTMRELVMGRDLSGLDELPAICEPEVRYSVQ
jgi:DNA adenine methylase